MRAAAISFEKQWLDERSELIRLLLLARGEIYHQEDCVPGGPCECENGALMRRIDAVLGVA